MENGRIVKLLIRLKAQLYIINLFIDHILLALYVIIFTFLNSLYV